MYLGEENLVKSWKDATAEDDIVFFFVSLITWLLGVVCSGHYERLKDLPFWTFLSIYWLSDAYVINILTIVNGNTFPQASKGEISRNWSCLVMFLFFLKQSSLISRSSIRAFTSRSNVKVLLRFLTIDGIVYLVQSFVQKPPELCRRYSDAVQCKIFLVKDIIDFERRQWK